jgi:hypothetical protein
VRFGIFNHPDTDIVIDGIEYQIKATDSASYINSAVDHIPSSSPEKKSETTGSIDGATPMKRSHRCGAGPWRPIIDLSDTALDTVFSVSASSASSGWSAHSARRIHRETGDAVGGLGRWRGRDVRGIDLAVITILRATARWPA